MTRFRFCFLFLLGCSLTDLAAAGSPPRQAQVRAELLADASGLQADSGFQLGVLFHIEPGWHIYWQDPGDAGLATEVRFSVPGGFQVGDLLWPQHQSWTQPGDIVGHGYSGSVLLFAPVQAAAKLPEPGPIALNATARWLACKEVCIPGKAELTLELPVVDRPEPANRELFTAWAQKLPAATPSP